MDGGIASGVDVGASRDEMEGVVMDSIGMVNYYAAGRKQYDAGDYAGAYRNMEQELAVHPQNMDAKLYAGLSQLIQEKPAQALPYFRDVASSPSATATQREDAEWYAALSLLKMKDKEKASTLLRGIVAKNGRYALKAQQTLDTMD
jgi:tetratricopeptide (TPR) repeat protein